MARMQGDNQATLFPATDEIAEEIRHFAELQRQEAESVLSNVSRGELGQFTTPSSIANTLASYVSLNQSIIRILDVGAGSGTLAAHAIANLLLSKEKPEHISVIAYEVDTRLTPYLVSTLVYCGECCEKVGVGFDMEICAADFITSDLSDFPSVDLVIMNPPYRKIRSDSEHRQSLRLKGIETSNLYTGFMLLAARALNDDGQFISITPRSFCNGSYFTSFRREFLSLVHIDALHIYASRKEAFKDASVLQENVILSGRQSGKGQKIKMCLASNGDVLSTLNINTSQVIRPNDDENIIHIITSKEEDALTRRFSSLRGTLDSIGLNVSTGRVVDFRAKSYLRLQASKSDVPLIYPSHFVDGRIDWPSSNARKANAIEWNDETDNLFVPRGYYVLTKRFSAKEEKRRIVAATIEPTNIPTEVIGFDNKTNYFHNHGSPLSASLARGLALWLNSTVVDRYFRLFSGHTQVNAADLRRMPYPIKEQLVELGRRKNVRGQAEIDAAVESTLDF